MTGENFIRMGGRTDIKELKEKIQALRDKAGLLENINTIRDYGFDSDQHYKLSKRIHELEYILWGLTR